MNCADPNLNSKRWRVLWQGGCHFLALKLYDLLSHKGFELKRIEVVDEMIPPMYRALHVYVTRGAQAVDWAGLRSDTDVLKHYEKGEHARGRSVIGQPTNRIEIESPRIDEPDRNIWRLRLDAEFRKEAERCADEWISEHRALLDSL